MNYSRQRGARTALWEFQEELDNAVDYPNEIST